MTIKMDGRTAGAIVVGGLTLGGVGVLVYKLYKYVFPYDADGFDGSGYDAEGYDHHGFSAKGYNRSGYDHNGYDHAGFNTAGIDRNGYGPDGYNLAGFDADGFNRDGCDKDGFDRRGYDAVGFHKNGYNRQGFNREGYDWDGYGRNGYNPAGQDRAGKTAQFYEDYLQKMYEAKEEAFMMIDAGKFGYALYKTRLVLEDAVRLVIGHTLGPRAVSNNLLQDMNICETKNLLRVDSDYLGRLHGVRKICNLGIHTLEGAESKSVSQVYFAFAQVRDLIPVVRAILVG